MLHWLSILKINPAGGGGERTVWYEAHSPIPLGVMEPEVQREFPVSKTRENKFYPECPLQYSCLETPVDGGAWEPAVHGVLKTWTRPSHVPFFHVPSFSAFNLVAFSHFLHLSAGPFNITAFYTLSLWIFAFKTVTRYLFFLLYLLLIWWQFTYFTCLYFF